MSEFSVSDERHMAEQPACHRSENFSTKNFVIPLIFLKSDDIITRERFWSELFLCTKTRGRFNETVQTAERRNCCEGKIIRKTYL